MSLEQELAPFDYDLQRMYSSSPTCTELGLSVGVGSWFDAQLILRCHESRVFSIRRCLGAEQYSGAACSVQARRSTGGRVEVFFLQNEPDMDGYWYWWPPNRLKVGETIVVEQLEANIRLMERQEDGQWRVETCRQIKWCHKSGMFPFRHIYVRVKFP